MKKHTLIIFVLVFTIIASFTSCKKENVVEEKNTMEQLSVDPSFKWSTTTSYTLNLTGYANSLVKIVSSDNIVYHQSMLIKGSAVAVNVTLPSYFQKVNLIYMGNSYEINLTESTINFSF